MKSKNPFFEKVKTCKNCGSENIDKYCSNCGQKVFIKRFTLKAFLWVLIGTFTLERGFYHTVLMMFLKPGKLLNDYIKGKTREYINPLKYLFIIGGLFAFIMIKTDIIDSTYKSGNTILYNSNEELKQGYEEIKDDEQFIKMQENVLKYTKGYINVIPMIVIPFYSLILLLFYRSRKLFYGEVLIMNSFIFAQTFLITILILVPLIHFIPALKSFFPFLTFITSIVYLSYALNTTFKESPVMSVIKSFFIYIFGTIVFWIFLVLLILILMIIFSILGISLIDIMSS